MKRTTIEKSIFFNVPPNVVWDYLVDNDKLSSWFHPARENLTLDEDYALIDGDGHALCWGKVLQMTLTAKSTSLIRQLAPRSLSAAHQRL